MNIGPKFTHFMNEVKKNYDLLALWHELVGA